MFWLLIGHLFWGGSTEVLALLPQEGTDWVCMVFFSGTPAPKIIQPLWWSEVLKLFTYHYLSFLSEQLKAALHSRLVNKLMYVYVQCFTANLITDGGVSMKPSKCFSPYVFTYLLCSICAHTRCKQNKELLIKSLLDSSTTQYLHSVSLKLHCGTAVPNIFGL